MTSLPVKVQPACVRKDKSLPLGLDAGWRSVAEAAVDDQAECRFNLQSLLNLPCQLGAFCQSKGAQRTASLCASCLARRRAIAPP
ncbi:MAG: hypothetical protein HC899_29865, partial [Leptolyngbyaceae cyanobacterium SM1_4_3]|nr:hypothetical protein [Leptolyngbyaceae cyanobacterium SM1_4_3]